MKYKLIRIIMAFGIITSFIIFGKNVKAIENIDNKNIENYTIDYSNEKSDEDDEVADYQMDDELMKNDNDDLEKETYKIVFDGNGSTNGLMRDMEECEKGVEYSLLKNQYTKIGYQFIGWNTKFDGSGQNYQDGQLFDISNNSIDNIVTLYAQWKANAYNILFNKNGATSGKIASMNNINYDKEVTLNSNQFIRTNYIFTGWNTRADGKGISYKNKQVVKNLTSQNGNKVVLYAQWRLKRYNIQFLGNSSTSGTMNTMVCQYTKSYRLNSNKYVRKGYKFLGWNTRKDGKGKTYKNCQGIQNLSSSDGACITLYAQWEKNTYKITYQLNGGKNNRNPQLYTVTTCNIKLSNPTRTNYTFQGWYLDKNYKTKVKQINKGSVGNIKLYAKWRLNRYSIVFHGNGGTGTMGYYISAKIGDEFYIPICNFVRNGYYCTGWNTQASGNGRIYNFSQKVKNLSKKDGAVINLYASWKKCSSTESNMSNQVVKLVNKERAKKGLSALKTNKVLNGIAQQRAKEISMYFSHDRLDGNSCFELCKTAGYQYSYCGENIAAGFINANSVMNGWMNSSGHRANILLPNFKEIGVGCYYQDGIYYWVQVFGTR